EDHLTLEIAAVEGADYLVDGRPIGTPRVVGGLDPLGRWGIVPLGRSRRCSLGRGGRGRSVGFLPIPLTGRSGDVIIILKHDWLIPCWLRVRSRRTIGLVKSASKPTRIPKTSSGSLY